MERLEDQLKAIVVAHAMLNSKPEEIGDDDDLYAKWNIDSPAVFAIVIGLEEVYGIEFSDTEFSRDKFQTVSKIAEVVRGKQV